MMLIEDDIEGAKDIIVKTLSELKDALGGESSIFLLPGYVILAEANIIDNKLKKVLIIPFWYKKLYILYLKYYNLVLICHNSFSPLDSALQKSIFGL